MMSIQGLGQVIEPQPIEQIQEQAYAGLQTFWNRIREECEERFSPSQCQALLGVRPTMLEPQQRAGLPWYMLVLIGVGIGKVIL